MDNHSTVWLDWSYGGVDFDLPGNGGLECRDHVTFSRRIGETIIGVALPFVLYVLHKLTYPPDDVTTPQEPTPKAPSNFSPLRLLLLMSLSFIFGIEVGYKFATKQLIFLLNPCHVTSAVQMYLLASPADPWPQTLFKVRSP